MITKVIVYLETKVKKIILVFPLKHSKAHQKYENNILFN